MPFLKDRLDWCHVYSDYTSYPTFVEIKFVDFRYIGVSSLEKFVSVDVGVSSLVWYKSVRTKQTSLATMLLVQYNTQPYTDGVQTDSRTEGVQRCIVEYSVVQYHTLHYINSRRMYNTVL